ncbi:MAG: DUF3795 domain-containing protein [Oscillospiraceae bacterium]|nr:DUF3795 domain-containing protein [Oscillospiraceae bacterium]
MSLDVSGEVFKEGRGIGYCGMACVLCKYEGYDDCPGCVATVNDREDDCYIRQCARNRGVGGCYACPDHPCGKDYGPLKDKRNKAFLRFAKEFGTQALIDRLRINNENGIIYCQPGAKPHNNCGDYDALETEQEIYDLLRYGREK